jgi:ornithine carbamoyltransferase
MGSKTVVHEPASPEASLRKPSPQRSAVQSDTAFSEASKRLAGRDLCSIADLSVQRDGRHHGARPRRQAIREDFRHALDAKQMVMFFEKASLRTRLTFEAGINTLGGNAIFVDQTQSPLGERESSPTWRATSSAG